MKTTVEIPDHLFRRTKATAALRGESLKEFFIAALRARLDSPEAGSSVRRGGWRSVYGQARPEEVQEIDAIVAEELEHIDPGEWR